MEGGCPTELRYGSEERDILATSEDRVGKKIKAVLFLYIWP